MPAATKEQRDDALRDACVDLYGSDDLQVDHDAHVTPIEGGSDCWVACWRYLTAAEAIDAVNRYDPTADSEGERMTTTEALDEARTIADRVLTETIHANPDTFGQPREADPVFNQAYRVLAESFVLAHPAAQCGVFNGSNLGDLCRILEPAECVVFHNFSADFIVPKWDRELSELITDYRMSGLDDGMVAASERLAACYDRIAKIDGCMLHWA